MAMAKEAGALLMMLMALFGVCFGAAYTVGDSAGWNVGINYKQWASAKNFQVGDTLVFDYNNQFHNVLQVSREDYKYCNTRSPIAIFASGQDSITLQQAGHFYFLSGFPGDCQSGFKVNIKVRPCSQAPSVVPSPPPPRVPPSFNCPPPQSGDSPFAPVPPGQPFDNPFVPGPPGQPFDPFKNAASSRSSQFGVALAIIVFLLASFAY